MAVTGVQGDGRNGGRRDWDACPGSSNPARWISHPLVREIDIPICPVCGHNGFRAVGIRGLVPRHAAEKQGKVRYERDYKAEFARRKARRDNGEDIRL